MHVGHISFLQFLLICHLSPAVLARAFPPLNALTIADNGTSAGNLDNCPLYDGIFKRRNIMSNIHGLPHPMYGVFTSVYSFQPPLPIAAFTKFFCDAAIASHNDNVPGRKVQRFSYGALMLEVMAITNVRGVDGNIRAVQGVVYKEFMEAVALWLLDSAQKGWTEFFEAWVTDKAEQGTVYYVQLANTWDSWQYKDLFS